MEHSEMTSATARLRNKPVSPETTTVVRGLLASEVSMERIRRKLYRIRDDRHASFTSQVSDVSVYIDDMLLAGEDVWLRPEGLDAGLREMYEDMMHAAFERADLLTVAEDIIDHIDIEDHERRNRIAANRAAQ